jgi:EpsI family protein
MIKLNRFMTVYILFALVALYLATHADTAVPINKPFTDFPVRRGGWQMTYQQQFTEGELAVLKPTDYLSRQYVSPDGQRVSLYLGYHSGGKGTGGIHSPKHCLPGSGWYEVSSAKAVVPVAGESVNLVKAVYQKGEGKELFLYWFQVRDASLNDEYQLKFAEITNSATSRRRDSTFIRISVPFESDRGKAEAVGLQFINDFLPVIREFLPR